MKTKSQREFEAAIRRSRGLAHPAAPVDGGSGWEMQCEREGCDETFLTPTKQRRYCSTRCRRIVEEARTRRQEHLEGLLLYQCAAPRCTDVFLPERPGHMFCSAKCRKRAHRASSDLSPARCASCKKPLPPRKTRRLRYCGATCRKRASRNQQVTTVMNTQINHVRKEP